MPPPGMGRKSITQQILGQQSNLLRKGVGGSGQKFDKIRQRHIWSTYCFHATTGGAISTSGLLAPNDYPVFTTPAGQNGQGYPSGLTLNLIDTNVPGANRVSDNQNFSIWEVGITIVPNRDDVLALDTANLASGDPHPEDKDLILQNGCLQIIYLTNRYTLGHLQDFAEPGGPSITVPTLLDYAGNTNVAGNGGGLNEGLTSGTPWDDRIGRLTRMGGQIAPAPALRRVLEVPIFLQSGDTFSWNLNFSRSVQLRPVSEGGTGGFSVRLDWWAVESFRQQG